MAKTRGIGAGGRQARQLQDDHHGEGLPEVGELGRELLGIPPDQIRPEIGDGYQGDVHQDGEHRKPVVEPQQAIEYVCAVPLVGPPLGGPFLVVPPLVGSLRPLEDAHPGRQQIQSEEGQEDQQGTSQSVRDRPAHGTNAQADQPSTGRESPQEPNDALLGNPERDETV